MGYEKMNPAPLAAGRALNSSYCLQAQDGSEIKPTDQKTQDFRAAWLARHARISFALAATLAPLAFGPEAR